MSKTQNVADLGKGLGGLVWWDLFETKVRPADLRAILVNEGETAEAAAKLVKDIDELSAVKRAAREWTQGRGSNDRFRADVISSSDKDAVIGILRRVAKGAREVAWEQVDTIEFAGSGWSQMPTTAEGLAFAGLADSYRIYLDHQWIRPNLIMRRLEEARAFPLRRQGGVYYVLNGCLPEVERLARVVSKIGNSRIHIAHVGATDSSREAIASAARESLADRIRDIREKMETWKGKARGRTSTMESMINEFTDLRNSADLYADALAMSLDDLKASIASAAAEAKALIIGGADGAPETAPRQRGLAPVTYDGVLTYKVLGAEATGRIEEGGFTILAGSTAVNRSHLRGKSGTVKDELVADGTLVEDGDKLRFTRDTTFASATRAGEMVAGRTVNGRDTWKTGDGKTINDMIATGAISEPETKDEPTEEAPEAPQAPDAPEADTTPAAPDEPAQEPEAPETEPEPEAKVEYEDGANENPMVGLLNEMTNSTLAKRLEKLTGEKISPKMRKADLVSQIIKAESAATA